MDSVNSRSWAEQITQICQCGEPFENTIWHLPDKTTRGNYKTCRACRDKAREEFEERELEAQLAETRERLTDLWFEESGIDSFGVRYASKKFADFDVKAQPVAYKAVSTLDWQSEEAKSLVLLSPSLYGVGKTHLVAALVNQVIEQDTKAEIHNKRVITHSLPVYITTEANLLRSIRVSFQPHAKQTEQEVYNSLSVRRLLIIDDVGKVRPRDMNWTQGVYFEIIDDRYISNSSIILTTNLDFPELEAHIGGACADRLREMCRKDGFIKMTGKSWRQR